MSSCYRGKLEVRQMRWGTWFSIFVIVACSWMNLHVCDVSRSNETWLVTEENRRFIRSISWPLFWKLEIRMFIFGSRDNMSSGRQATAMTNSTTTVNTPRRNRYARSSTTSVTQLLSDSCSSLLQRLTTRVRGPSSTTDRTTLRRSPVTSHLTAARNRLEDRYTTFLDRYTTKKRHDENVCSNNNNYKRREDREHSYHKREDSPYVRDDKTLEPSLPRATAKPSTYVLLSEKAYPYVSSATGREIRREKTPAYHRHDRQALVNNNSEAYRRYGRHKSGHAETRNRKVRPLHRSGKSAQPDSSSSAQFSRSHNYPADSTITKSPDEQESTKINNDKTPIVVNEITSIKDLPNDEALTEREAKRKEIQTLIMKYSALDEASGNSNESTAEHKPSTADIIASKYRRNTSKISKSRHETKNIDAITSAIVSLSRKIAFLLDYRGVFFFHPHTLGNILTDHSFSNSLQSPGNFGFSWNLTHISKSLNCEILHFLLLPWISQARVVFRLFQTDEKNLEKLAMQQEKGKRPWISGEKFPFFSLLPKIQGRRLLLLSLRQQFFDFDFIPVEANGRCIGKSENSFSVVGLQLDIFKVVRVLKIYLKNVEFFLLDIVFLEPLFADVHKNIWKSFVIELFLAFDKTIRVLVFSSVLNDISIFLRMKEIPIRFRM